MVAIVFIVIFATHNSCSLESFNVIISSKVTILFLWIAISNFGAISTNLCRTEDSVVLFLASNQFSSWIAEKKMSNHPMVMNYLIHLSVRMSIVFVFHITANFFVRLFNMLFFCCKYFNLTFILKEFLPSDN